MEREPPLAPVPMSASASASSSAAAAAAAVIPGPPNLALSLRFSFDTEGSLGDSIERYFLSSQPGIDISRAGQSPPEPTTISIVPAASAVPAVPAASAVPTAPVVPIDPTDITFRGARADGGTTTTATTGQPQLTNNNVNITRVNSKSNPTVSIVFTRLIIL